jgi:hypothetical protein
MADEELWTAFDQRILFCNVKDKPEGKTTAAWVAELVDKYGPAVIDSMAYSPTTGDKKASVILIIRRVSTCAECGEAIKYGNYVCKECKDA